MTVVKSTVKLPNSITLGIKHNNICILNDQEMLFEIGIS